MGLSDYKWHKNSKIFPERQGWCLSLAAVTQYYTQGDLNNRHLFVIVLEAVKSRIKVLADLVLGEGALPGQHLIHILTEQGGEGRGGRGQDILVSSYKGINPFMRTLPSRAHLNLLTSHTSMFQLL